MLSGPVEAFEIDAVHTQGINVDEWASRVVDRILLRKQPRDTGFDE